MIFGRKRNLVYSVVYSVCSIYKKMRLSICSVLEVRNCRFFLYEILIFLFIMYLNVIIALFLQEF